MIDSAEGYIPPQKEVLPKSPQSVREIARTSAIFLPENRKGLSESLLDTLSDYADPDSHHTDSQELAGEFEKCSEFAQELYMHGEQVRKKLGQIPGNDGTVTLMRGDRKYYKNKQTWAETIRSYTSNPNVANHFAGNGYSLLGTDDKTIDHTALPLDSTVEVKKVPISDIIDVIGNGDEEEFLVLNREKMPEQALNKLLRINKSPIRRVLNRMRMFARY